MTIPYKPITPESTILVTGASGFIGAHCVQQLLEAGYTVKAAVRSPQKFQTLQSCFESDKLQYAIVSDITNYDEVAKALKGCDGVLHLASPFSYNAKDFETELMKPAIQGTTCMLSACLHEPSVKRVVITSSFAAVFDSSKGPQPGVVYTEKDFSPLTYQDGVDTKDVALAYRASKVVAEQAAWDFIKTNTPAFDITVLCPAMVFGPLVSPSLLGSIDQLNESNSIVWSVATSNQIPPTKAPLYIDVRDLAAVHVKALTTEQASNNRYVLSAGDYDNQEIADILRTEISDEGFRKKVPIGQPGHRLAGSHFTTDSARVVEHFGTDFKLLKESVVDLCTQLIENY